MADSSQAVIGVVGAGTMGGGIATVAALAGYQVIVQDVSREILDRAGGRLEEYLEQRVARGRLEPAAAADARSRLRWVTRLEDLADAGVVIEAAPEHLDLKRGIFTRLDEVCGPDAILASNTSSLSITAIAAAARRPERVVGMHFFNPVPAMPLVEIVRGERTSDATADAADALARAFGKTPVHVRDAPGFLVNRVARPFYGEALHLLADGVASAETIDRIMRDAGGFRMGPFELLDLIGLDVSLAVTRSVFDAFFQDPRYRPHPLQQRMVDAGLLGRKSGRGFYDYAGGRPAPQVEKSVERQGQGMARRGGQRFDPVGVVGGGRVATDLVRALRAAGLGTLTDPPRAGLWDVPVAIEASLASGDDKARSVASLEALLSDGALLLVLTLTAPVTEAARLCAHPERVVGLATLPSLTDRRVVEVQAGLRTDQEAVARASAFCAAVGKTAVEVGDCVAGVFPRIQAMLSHEAIMALAERIAAPGEIDTAMRLGVNYPQGPIERAEVAGLDTVLAVMSGLFAEQGDPRYRPAPLLRRLVAAGRTTVDA